MNQKLASILSTGDIKGTEVMGVTEDSCIFKGEVLDVVQYDHGIPNVLLVEGTLFDGSEKHPFRQDVMVDILKSFDLETYNTAAGMIEHSELAINNAVYFKERCKELMQ